MSWKYVLWFAIGVLLLVPCEPATEGEGDIFLAQGRLRGKLMQSENKEEFYAYYGIPYAQAPVKELRFQDSVRHHGWEHGVRIGKHQPPPCPQWDHVGKVIGEENCLFVNVFTSRKQQPVRVNDTRLPVMVFIHGGDFLKGGIYEYGPEKLMDDPKVLVFVQYRLGALGFTSTEDETFLGNYGLTDIILALEWIQDNIYNFGGNESRVTVFGSGAGGVAISAFMVSPRAEGLFSAAIIQSGSVLCDWTIEKHPARFAESLAEALGCPHENRSEMLTCMRSKSINSIIEEQTRLQRKSFMWGLKPVIDAKWRSKPVFRTHPQELYESGDIHPVPIIAGVARDEGLSPLQWLLSRQHTLLRNGSRLENEYIPKILDSVIDDEYDASTLWEGAKTVYFQDVSFDHEEETIPPLVELLGDAMFHYCMDKLLRLHSAKVPGKTFAYVFGIRYYATYEDPANKELKDLASRSTLFNRAVKHADELPCLFNMTASKTAVPMDLKVEPKMPKIWSNFATSGEPTPEDDSKKRQMLWPPPRTPIRWPSYNPKSQIFYHFQQISSLWPGGFRHRELATWQHLLHDAAKAAEAIRIAELNKDPYQPYRAVMWATSAAAAFLMLVVLVLAGILVGTGKTKSEPIKLT